MCPSSSYPIPTPPGPPLDGEELLCDGILFFADLRFRRIVVSSRGDGFLSCLEIFPSSLHGVRAWGSGDPVMSADCVREWLTRQKAKRAPDLIFSLQVETCVTLCG